MSDIQLIASRFVEDRGSLSEAEMGELINALQVDRQLAAELKEQLLIDDLLAQQIAVDRQNFPAQMEQRVSDHHGGADVFLQRTKRIPHMPRPQPMSQVASRERQRIDAVPRTAERRRTARRRWWAAAAAMLLLVCLGTAHVAWSVWRDVAFIDSVVGEVHFLRNGQEQVAVSEARLQDGDKLITGAAGTLVVRFRDGTRVHAGPDTAIAYQSGWGKIIDVTRGNVSARVAPQPLARSMTFQTPSADAEVLGTELQLAVRPAETRLDVTSGEVRLARTKMADAIVVSSAQFGVATPARLFTRQLNWPSSPAGVVFYTYHEAGLGTLLASTTGSRLFYKLVAQGDASFDRLSPGTLAFEGGLIRAEDSDDANRDLLESLQATDQLTLECVLRTDSFGQRGPARIVTFSTDSSSYNFSLGQEGDRIVFRLLTADPRGGSQESETTLCRLEDTQRHHLVAAYRDKQLLCYLDGERVMETDAPAGSFDAWGNQHFVFGNERNGERGWQGTLEAVAVYNRVLNVPDIQRQAAHFGLR